MNTETIARRRARAQRLWGDRLATPVDVVRWLTAMQSQEHQYARWSVAQRASRATAADVDRAFDAGLILRTHVLRPTWHYVVPDDLRWLLDLSGPRVDASNASRYRNLGLDTATLRKGIDIVAAAVADGPCDRRELGAALEASGISAEGQRLPHLLLHAELNQVICSGPMRQKQHTYVAFDERVPPAPKIARDEALATLARRYLGARGPATVDDFAWWSGLAMGDARSAFESISSELTRDDVEGRTYWSGADAPPRSRAGIDFVQCFDEAIISYRESRDVLSTRAVDFKTPFAVDGFTHVLLAGGRLLGHWRLERASGGHSLRTRLRRRITASERSALDRSSARVRSFFGAA